MQVICISNLALMQEVQQRVRGWRSGLWVSVCSSLGHNFIACDILLFYKDILIVTMIMFAPFNLQAKSFVSIKHMCKC